MDKISLVYNYYKNRNGKYDDPLDIVKCFPIGNARITLSLSYALDCLSGTSEMFINYHPRFRPYSYARVGALEKIIKIKHFNG